MPIVRGADGCPVAARYIDEGSHGAVELLVEVSADLLRSLSKWGWPHLVQGLQLRQRLHGKIFGVDSRRTPDFGTMDA